MIAKKTWREIRWMALVYMFLLETLLIPAVMLWPNLRGAFGGIAPIQSFRDMLRDISRDSDMAFSAYMGVQMFFKGANIVGISCAVLLGTGLIARERENQTLEFLLSRPITRSRILFGKFSVCAVAVIVPIFLTSWTAVPLATLVEEKLSFTQVTLGAIHSSAFVLLFLSITCMCSVWFRTQVHAAFAVGGLITAQIAVYFIQDIRVGSLFMLSDYTVYGPIMAGNRSLGDLLTGSTAWILLGSLICYLIADRSLKRVSL